MQMSTVQRGGSSCSLGKTNRLPGSSSGGTRTFRKPEKKANREVPKDESPKTRLKKSFGTQKPVVCFRRKMPGHVATGSPVPKVSPVQFVLEKESP